MLRQVRFVVVCFDERGLLFRLLPDPLRSALEHSGMNDALGPTILTRVLTIQDLQIPAPEADQAARSSSYSKL